jgi:autotransporter-associated beta strand protein
MNFKQTSTGSTAGAALNVTGANGYKLQFTGLNVTLMPAFANAWSVKLNPTTAPLIIAGTVQQVAGCTNGTTTLNLDGTNVANQITGSIKDSADAAPKVLNLSKTSSGTWTLSATNTFTGSTTVSGGTLVLAGGTCLSDTNLLTISTGGKVQLEAGVKEKVGLLNFGATPQSTGTWGSTSSSAQNTSTNFLGTGILYVGIDIPASGTLIQIR